MTCLSNTLRRLAPTPREHREATAILGEDHPFTLAVARHRSAALQALATALALPVGAGAALTQASLAIVILCSGAVVGLVFAVHWLSSRRTLLRRTQQLIARGEATIVIPTITRERRRLGSRRERERLASALEHALEESWNWYRYPPPSRPLEGIQFLCESAAETADVVARLRADRVRVQGVARVARLLVDADESPLYSGHSARLREELTRIRSLLEPAASDAREEAQPRAAA